MTYAIYEGLYPTLEYKISRIIKKCERYGGTFTFKKVSEEIRPVKSESGYIYNYKFFIVEVEGTAKINDWEFIGTIDIFPQGNIIRRANTEIQIPGRFYSTKNVCEHCQTARTRKALYLIHNVKTDDWKQVGGDCLKLYTNGLNMEYISAYMDGLTELESCGTVPEGSEKKYFPVFDIIRYAYLLNKKIGYRNTQTNVYATKTLISYFFQYDDLQKAVQEINRNINRKVEPKDFEINVNAEISEIINYYKNQNSDSEFIRNVKILLDEGYAKQEHFGFLCYLPEGYARYTREQKEKEIAAKPEYFGEIGKRYTLHVESVDCVARYDTAYGTTRIYKINLENGIQVTWKTTNSLVPCTDYTYDKFTFTVKSHTEYRGEKQTEVTRGKMEYKEKQAG